MMNPLNPSLANLNSFESAVAGRRYDAAVNSLHLLLSDFLDLSQGKQTPPDFYLRLTAALSQLFCDKNFSLSEKYFQLLSAHHASIAMAFTLAGFENADHVFAQLADVSDISNIVFPDQNAALKCLLLYNLSSGYELDLHDFSLAYPDLVTPILLGLLATRCLINEITEVRFNALLEQDWSHLSMYQPSLSNMVSISNSWMFCSYAHTAKKHQIKKTLNKIIKNWCSSSDIEKFQKQGGTIFGFNSVASGQKKVIMIPVEIMCDGHAMFRCFSRSLLQLKEHFHTIALAPVNCIDEAGAGLFSEVLRFEALPAFKNSTAFIAELKSLRVDAVYYPSLGMANYTLLLANQRLAPIQFFTLGHPATSHIDCMDYVFVQQQDLCKDTNQLREIFSEKIIVTGNETSSTLPRLSDFSFYQQYQNSEKHTEPEALLKVAITSTHMKINYTFFKTCKQIAEQSQKPLCFYIFPGANGPTLKYLEQEFKALLPQCQVFPSMSYENYMEQLSRCDLRLGTFPFGGANSNMDCFALALPFVALAGDEVHAQSDVGQLQQANLEILVTDTIEAYIEKALKLIHDVDFRQQVIKQMQSLGSNDFFNGKINQQGNFAPSVAFMFAGHEGIQKSTQQVWRAPSV